MLDFSVEIKFVDFIGCLRSAAGSLHTDKNEMEELRCRGTNVGIVSVVGVTDLLHLFLSDQVSVKFEAYLIHGAANIVSSESPSIKSGFIVRRRSFRAPQPSAVLLKCPAVAVTVPSGDSDEAHFPKLMTSTLASRAPLLSLSATLRCYL